MHGHPAQTRSPSVGDARPGGCGFFRPRAPAGPAGPGRRAPARPARRPVQWPRATDGPRGVTCLACGGRFPAFERYGLPPRPGLCPALRGQAAPPGPAALSPALGSPAAPGPGARCSTSAPRAPRHALRGAAGGRSAARATPRSTWTGARTTARLRPPHRFRRMDATRLRFPAGMFDVILCNNVLPFVPDDSAILAEIRRCLKPDGVAMVDVDVQVPRTTPAARLRRRDRPLHGRLRRHQRLSPLLRARLPGAPAARPGWRRSASIRSGGCGRRSAARTGSRPTRASTWPSPAPRRPGRSPGRRAPTGSS